ncbi:hypothetical protein TCAL_16116 [Tigriopus californicus]|uniref:Uncharacterized protein n=1 Tax=Tigriopus californicus TaxID=6832 RepID=A0A553PPY5_TIGCA|nr:hypothetical protein TCAL_16116 [Tigriopus californicus]
MIGPGMVGSGGLVAGTRVIRSGGMDWSRMIGSGFVDRASVIRGGLVGVIVGLTRVLDISHITRVVISHLVGHGLNAAIRQSHVILTIGGVAVSGLVGSKVDSRIIIMDSITVLIVSRLVLVIVTVVGGPAAMMRGSMIGSWGGMSHLGIPDGGTVGMVMGSVVQPTTSSEATDLPSVVAKVAYAVNSTMNNMSD